MSIAYTKYTIELSFYRVFSIELGASIAQLVRVPHW